MIEAADNIIQLITTSVATVVALYRAARLKSRAWSMLGLFSGVYSLGLLYWLMFILFCEANPEYSHIPDLCWYSSYLFLLLLVIYVREESTGKDSFYMAPGETLIDVIRRMAPVLWCIPVFMAGMCIFYMTHGDYLGNIAAAVLMTGLIWHAASGLLSLKGQNDCKKPLYYVILLFCFTEYGLWTTSCFWMGDTIVNPYFWFDLLLSLTFFMFVWALGKAVRV